MHKISDSYCLIPFPVSFSFSPEFFLSILLEWLAIDCYVWETKAVIRTRVLVNYFIKFASRVSCFTFAQLESRR